MARPRKKLDRETVAALAKLGLTNEEVAAVLKCSADTLTRRFKRELDSGHLEMKASLKRTQYDVAVNGKNPTMLIWLGKNYLGQKDVVEHGGGIAVTMRREEVIDKLTRKMG
jgi:hypothetical protein